MKPDDITFKLKGLTAKRYKEVLKKDKTGKMKVVLDKYIQFHKVRVAEGYYTKDDAEKYIEEFLWILSVWRKSDKAEQMGIIFVFEYVGNLVMKIDDDEFLELYRRGDVKFLVNKVMTVLGNEWNERRFTKTLGFWFNTLLPLLCGYMEVPYLLYSIWLFKPYLYEAVRDEIGRFSEFLRDSADVLIDEFKVPREYIILPSDVFKAERLARSVM